MGGIKKGVIFNHAVMAVMRPVDEGFSSSLPSWHKKQTGLRGVTDEARV